MAHMKNQFKNSNKNGGHYNGTGGGNKSHFGDNYTDKLLVHAITKG